MRSTKRVELGRQGRAQMFAENLAAAALCLMGHPDRWAQKRTDLLVRNPGERKFEFNIQLAGISVVVECEVFGKEKGLERDLSGNKADWTFGNLTVKLPEGQHKFRGWLLATGAVYVQPTIPLRSSTLADGRIVVDPDPSWYGCKKAHDPTDVFDEMTGGIGSTTAEAVLHLLTTWPSIIGLELDPKKSEE